MITYLSALVDAKLTKKKCTKIMEIEYWKDDKKTKGIEARGKRSGENRLERNEEWLTRMDWPVVRAGVGDDGLRAWCLWWRQWLSYGWHFRPTQVNQCHKASCWPHFESQEDFSMRMSRPFSSPSLLFPTALRESIVSFCFCFFFSWFLNANYSHLSEPKCNWYKHNANRRN